MKLFDDVIRTEQRPKKNCEPLFNYYNISARSPVAGIRELLDGWFQRLPESARADIRSRFRSPINSHHHGAFFELYLHELLSSIGFRVTPHPEMPNGILTCPDFVVSKDGQQLFYLEATLVSPSQEETASQARIAQVYDTLNQVKSPNFFLEITDWGAPATPPPGTKLRQDLEQWLSTLHPDKLGERLESTDWSHDGWHISFRAIIKPPELRGQPDVKPIGISGPAEFSQVDSHVSIAKATSAKATRYGNLHLPFVVAVNVINEFTDTRDVMNGLLGEETIIHIRRQDGTVGQKEDRNRDGAWVGPDGPKNRGVSAALIALNLTPWNIATQTPEMIHNPWTTKPLTADLWPFHQWIPNPRDRQLKRQSGQNTDMVLDLPSPWPFPEEPQLSATEVAVYGTKASPLG